MLMSSPWAAPMLLVLMPAVAVASVAGAPPQAPVCASCHGLEAPSPHEQVPTIHGLPEAVLENALYDFRATIRPCREPDCGAAADCPASNCCAAAASLSDEDIAALARWYARQAFVPADEPWDAELAAIGGTVHAAHCQQCHADGAADPAGGTSALRGQRKAYLLAALEDFQLERRVAYAEMHAMLGALPDFEIIALVEFYASPRQP